MSSAHRRANSTDPRPGSTNFPPISIRPTKEPTHLRVGSAEPPRPPRLPRPEHTGFPRMTMRPAAERSHLRMAYGDARAAPPRRASQPGQATRPAMPRHDAATKTQMNQTLAIAMMASPVNPLPFFLPVPLGVTMLLGPSNDRTGPAKETARR